MMAANRLCDLLLSIVPSVANFTVGELFGYFELVLKYKSGQYAIRLACKQDSLNMKADLSAKINNGSATKFHSVVFGAASRSV
jgi:hypothetical protein